MPRSVEGFSALELLLVIATIAVLAGLYVSNLSRLPAHAKAIEALSLAGVVRSEMALYYASHGEWPDHETLVNTTQFKRDGKYTRAISIEQDAISISVDTPQTYQISLRPLLKSDPPHSLRILCAYASVPPEWQVLGDNNSDIPVSYLPSTCR